MVVVIVQARMGSSRLPGKVMKNVLGKPLISYLLERVSRAKKVDKIILATTSKTEDNVLADYANSIGHDVFRGSEDDVLSRYYEAFKSIGSNDNENSIVRITGDCPLVEPKLIDKVIDKYIDEDMDYVALTPDFAEGLDVEIFSESLLNQAFNEAKLPSEREHVALFFHNNSKFFKMSRVENDVDDSHYRITVDELEDFGVIKSIIEYFDKNNLKLNFKNIKHYLDTHQEIFNLNAHILRNEGLKRSLEREVENGF